MKLLKLVILIAYCTLLFSCSPLNHPDIVPQNATSWDIQFSPGMPPHPSSSNTWYFDFPNDPNYPACVQNNSCASVHYVDTMYSQSVIHTSITMTFTVTTTGSVVYNGNLQTDNTCNVPASVRLYFQQKGDNLSSDGYRWWSNPVAYQLGSQDNTTITLSVPVDSVNWTGLYGERDAARMAVAWKNVGRVGMTFGGGCFFGHGVNISNGTARFNLTSYEVN